MERSKTMSVNTVTTISQLLTKAFEGWTTWLSTRDAAYKRSKDKRLTKALNFAESYILTDLDNAIDDGDKVKLKKKYAKLFWKFNG